MIEQTKRCLWMRARKVGGSYQATGTILTTFTTQRGFVRHVFEFDEPAGLLHIFNPEQLEMIQPGGDDGDH